MADINQQDPIAEIWKLFKETDAKFKETQAELDRRFTETSLQFKETQAELDRRFTETDARLAQQSAETNRKINRLEGIMGMQWGRLIEALVKPSCLHLFQERGIDVHHVYERVKAPVGGETMEIDILLENGQEVVVIEIKSVLRVRDVQDFLRDLESFFHFFPQYKGYKVYGAITGLEMLEEASRYAYKQGLFVLAVEGEGLVQMKNDTKFRPKDFG